MIDSMPLFALAPSYADQARAGRAFAPPKSRPGDGQTFAVVPIVGTLFKDQTVWIREQINRLARDTTVGEILLHIDSPGGESAGIADTYTAIAKAATVKQVTSFIEDLGGSAAYWLASAANQVIANRTAIVGSIGVFLAVADLSALHERLGIRVVVVRSGAHKGATVEGAKLTEDQIEQLQIRVDALARIFIGDVAAGRKMTVARVRDLADGRVFVGAAAQAAGLVDAIGTLEQVLGAARIRTLGFARGPAAIEAFAELVAASKKERPWSKHPAGYVVEQYPELAAAAAEEEQKSRPRKEDWRRQF